MASMTRAQSVLTRGLNELKADRAVSLFVYLWKKWLISQLCFLSTYCCISYFGHCGYWWPVLVNVFMNPKLMFAKIYAHAGIHGSNTVDTYH